MDNKTEMRKEWRELWDIIETTMKTKDVKSAGKKQSRNKLQK
jgi:hypothetical protein